MKIRTFAVLFVGTIVPLFIGMGLFPLLPLYAARFGATQTDIGFFYAVVYIASAASIVGTGWLAERLPRRGLFLAGAVAGPVTMALLGHVTAFWQVVVLIAAAWMCGGVTITLLNVFTATLAEPRTRGRVFGLMFLVYPLATLAGGAVVGQVTAAHGYTVMFSVLAAVWVIQPIVGLVGLRDPRITRAPARAEARVQAAPLGWPFALLLASTLLSIAGNSIGRLGASLEMQALNFGPDVVTSTSIVSGLATIPLTLASGAFSEGRRRRPMLALSTLLGAAGTAALIFATSAWQFQLAATLMLAGWCIGRAVGSAFATDMLRPEALGRGLPRLTAMDSFAGIVGFALTGYGMETLGAPQLFAVATALGLAAVAILVILPQTQRARRASRGPIVMDRSGAIVPQAAAER